MPESQTLAEARGPSEPEANSVDRQQNVFDVCKPPRNASWKLLFVVTEDFSFWDRRRPLAHRAREAGADVWVMTSPGPFAEKLRREGFRVIPWKVSRASLNPLREFGAFLQVLKAYRELRPDLVHHFALKPVVYGGLAARVYKVGYWSCSFERRSSERMRRAFFRTRTISTISCARKSLVLIRRC